MKKLLTITVPACLVTIVVILMLVEVAIRLTWNPSRGRPGLFISDPVRIERLSESYDGWFAGVPVRTNRLGFRDTREYALDKGPRTFRILVLGDSVTFGHGSIFEHTYPYLLEQRLKAWKPDVDWQVWNLGVPGYNASQALAYLLEMGPRSRPDLVIVGVTREIHYATDLENRPLGPPTRRAVVMSAVKTFLKRHMYSFDVYKKVYLTLRYRLLASGTERDLLQNLAVQEQLLAKPANAAGPKAQQLTYPAPMSDAEFGRARCTYPQITVFSADVFEHTPGVPAWKAMMGRFQELNRAGQYRIVFFLNSAPDVCRIEDVFDPRATTPLNDYYLKVLSDGAPAVSSHDTFLRYHPSEMPQASRHALGNANAVKASVLFEFLRDRVLFADAMAGRLQTSKSMNLAELPWLTVIGR